MNIAEKIYETVKTLPEQTACEVLHFAESLKAKQVEEERKRIAEIEKVKADERQKVVEEERIKKQAILDEEKRQSDQLAAIERAKVDERKAIEKELEIKEQAKVEAMAVKFVLSETEMVTYKIIASIEEFEIIEMYLASIGVEFLKGEF